MANKKKFQVLRRLKQVVKKVRLIISFNASKLFISSMARSPDSRRLVYRRQSSLLDCGSSFERDNEGFYQFVSLSNEIPKNRTVSRSTSACSSKEEGDEDVDRRAEEFIRNFHKHICMERQVSLKLCYCTKETNE
ncbi:hypothetical protein IHE45_09G008600 [Dioscorea alata]|uniref:Uncharacterized protein n=1 Tax=Dioscorea alata TaxID=55571 RepID=A0ACB7VCW3_DIOAL|nr:hypothetical protein IHE45_09G008600 [Dioscorea alata]